MKDREDLFNFTRARFVQNEAAELAARRVVFDVGELARTATRSVSASSCVDISRLPDGMHNRALFLTMDTGKQVVAKIPHPNAGQAHFATASEVATMEFMRTRMGTPVPLVYAWCNRAEETAVGAEYIIMDKAEGVVLESIWNELAPKQKVAVVKSVTRLQEQWAATSFESHGSIYYASALPERVRLPLQKSLVDNKFAIGPITGRDWNDNGRMHVAVDRGPWNTLESYLEAIGRPEAQCVKELPKRLHKSHSAVLSKDSALRRPYVWHGDFHLGNIFVDPEDPATTTSIIDWQSTEVAPLFVQARQPYFLDFEGPQLPDLTTKLSALPENFAQLSTEEQAAIHRLRVQQSLRVAYRRWILYSAPDIYGAFKYQDTPSAELLQLARVLFVDGEGIYIARIVEHLRSPDGILAGSGLSMSEAEMAEAEADGEKAILGIHWMTGISEALGPDLFPLRGCVNTEHYDESKNALQQCKEQVIREFAKTEEDREAWNEAWPWDD